MHRILIVPLLALAAPAAAQWPADVEARVTPEYKTCQASGDAAKGITYAMMNCLGTEIDVQDDRLNAAYRTTMQRTKRKTALRAAQRGWIKERDTKCRAAAERGGGSAAGLEGNGCILRETIARTIWLEKYR